MLVAGDKIAGLIAMRDEPRADAKEGIQALKDARVTPIMLTGDNRRTATAISASLAKAPACRRVVFESDESAVSVARRWRKKCVCVSGFNCHIP